MIFIAWYAYGFTQTISLVYPLFLDNHFSGVEKVHYLWNLFFLCAKQEKMI